MKKSVIVILVTIVVSFSCDKTENISEIPEIKFRNFSVSYKEYLDFDTKLTGTLTFEFIDGNGDLGFMENFDIISENNHNDIIVKEFYKENGEFKSKIQGPYLLPYFEEGIYRKNIRGQIEIFLIRETYSPDTVYYEFYIVDRAQNTSNTEITPVFIYSELIEQ